MLSQRKLRVICVKDLSYDIEEIENLEEGLDSTEFNIPNAPLDHISKQLKFFVLSNPSKEDDDPAYYIYYQDNLPVARLSTFADTLVINHRNYRWGWAADLRVHDDFKGQGIGAEFIKAVLEHMNHIGWVFGGFGIAAFARRIYLKNRFIDIGRIPRYVYPLSAKPILNALRVRGYFARALRLPIAWMLCLLRPKVTKSDTFLEEVEHYDRDAFSIFDRSQPDIGFLKTPEILNWKLLLAEKSTKFRYHAFKIRLSSQIIGWFVARFRYYAEYPGYPWIKDIHVCTIVDVGVDPGMDGKWDMFISLAIGTALKYEADVLEIYTLDQLFQKVLKRKSFKRIGGQDFMFRLPDKSSLPLDILGRSPGWVLSRGDSDGFYSI